VSGFKCLFQRFTVGSYPINGYLVADPETRIGVFIDPGGFDDSIAETITSLNIELRIIFFTHGHWDHVEGLPEFMRRYSVRCYAGKDEVKAANNTLQGGEILDVGKLHFHTFRTPGHTPGGISYYSSGLEMLFPGDALFCGSMGGTENAKEASLQIDHVRRHLFTLPDQTRVFPGHGPITTIAAEKYGNPFFQTEGP
jgi:glyoxylase-like metal-dependent hydrolase (beta-lactamase superfamily II)